MSATGQRSKTELSQNIQQASNVGQSTNTSQDDHMNFEESVYETYQLVKQGSVEIEIQN